MGLEFCSIASGSSGNSYMVRNDDTVLLVDAGVSGKRVLAGLETAEADFSDVQGIFLTHEHSDHVKSIKTVGRRSVHANVYGTYGTLQAVKDKLPEGRAQTIRNHDTVTVGGIRVTSFPISHDANDPCAYTFESGGKKLAIMTDTGYVSIDMFDHIKDADALVLESNHEVEILRSGPYPYPLKRRILSDLGHLSNDTAGEVLCGILNEMNERKMPTVVLGHLSHQNNTPAQARLTVENALFEQGYYDGSQVRLMVASRSEPGPLISVGD